MNEKIKKLAEQARVKDHWSVDQGRYLTNYLNEEKFAESIIQECARIADSADENSCEWIGGNILTYFGVKQ